MMTKGLIDGGATWRRQPEGTEAEANGGGRVVIDFDLARAQFMERAAAPDIAANVLKLGYVIAYKHMDVESKKAIVGQETLAADLNVSVRTVQKLLPVLQGLGLVIEPGAGRSNLSIYRVGSAASNPENAKAASPLDAERAKGVTSFDAERAKEGTLFSELTPPTRAGKQVAADGFAEFWQVYPRRVARGAAEKAYHRIIRSREATEAELLAGAMRYAGQRDGEDAQFTKHPATWLNGKCWMDEPPPNGGRPRSYLDSIAAGLALVPDDEVAS
jgi:hypothetical protein